MGFLVKQSEMDIIKNRVKALETHRDECDIKHTEHAEHRRMLYDKIDEAISYLKKISTTMEFIEQNKQTIIRTHNEYITKDTIKSWAGWIAIVAAAGTSVIALIKMFGE